MSLGCMGLRGLGFTRFFWFYVLGVSGVLGFTRV